MIRNLRSLFKEQKHFRLNFKLLLKKCNFYTITNKISAAQNLNFFYTNKSEIKYLFFPTNFNFLKDISNFHKK